MFEPADIGFATPLFIIGLCLSSISCFQSSEDKYPCVNRFGLKEGKAFESKHFTGIHFQGDERAGLASEASSTAFCMPISMLSDNILSFDRRFLLDKPVLPSESIDLDDLSSGYTSELFVTISLYASPTAR